MTPAFLLHGRAAPGTGPLWTLADFHLYHSSYFTPVVRDTKQLEDLSVPHSPRWKEEMKCKLQNSKWLLEVKKAVSFLGCRLFSASEDPQPSTREEPTEEPCLGGCIQQGAPLAEGPVERTHRSSRNGKATCAEKPLQEKSIRTGLWETSGDLQSPGVGWREVLCGSQHRGP